MPNFDELIQRSLFGINTGFEQAQDDLQRVVDEVSQAINKNIQLGWELSLSIIEEDAKKAIFELYLDFDPNDHMAQKLTIQHFQVSPVGYPIASGQYFRGKHLRDHVFEPYSTFKNVDELTQYFARLIEDPNSAFMQTLAFGMRQAKREKQVQNS